MELATPVLLITVIGFTLLIVVVVVAYKLHSQLAQAETSIDLSRKGCSIKFKTKK
jgi:hypothetical protein